MGTRAAGAILSIFGLLVALLGVEALVRLTSLDRSTLPEWSDRPHFYYIHERSWSFRDTAYSQVKGDGVFRLAVVGDSFSFGPYLQFDDTFPKKLERMLNLNASARRVEVVNYGVPRYSTSHEVALVQRAIREQADLVILQVTLNDPEIKPYRPTGLLSDEVNRWGQPELTGGIYRYWRTAALVMRRVYNFRAAEKYRKYFFDLFDTPENFKSFTQALDTIKNLAESAPVPLVSVTFPLFGQPLDESYVFRPLHEKVAAAMKERGIPNLSLIEQYRGIPPERLQVLPGRDFHPNEIGHRIAAESIYEWLVTLHRIPEEFVIKRTFGERIDIRIPGVDPSTGAVDGAVAAQALARP